MKKLKLFLNKTYDLPPMKVWHFLLILSGIFILGVCVKSEAQLPEKAYKWIEKAECGPFKPPCCHEDKNDPGGFTCVGIAVRSNANVMANIITNSYQKCKAQAVSTLKGPQKYRIGCKSYKPAQKEIMDAYYQRYYKQFKECPFKIALQIMDSKVLSGQGIRLFQRSQGLVADNIWGPNTEKACKNKPNMKKFKQIRLNRFKKLKSCKYHCKGWFKRLNNLEKYIEKL